MTFPETAFKNAENVIDERVSVLDVLYSFGTAHPGAITLHNYPRFLQDLQMPDGRRLDLKKAVDVLRDRSGASPATTSSGACCTSARPTRSRP